MTTTFPLLDAPPEIRQKIYHHLLYNPSPISINSPTAHTNYPLHLLQTCLQIYQEVRPLYFSINTFCISVHKHNPDWEYILGPGNDDGKGIDDKEGESSNSSILWQDRRRLIRTLRLNVVRWGSKDFFCARLMPALEDMVLNGNLRILEVWLREDHLIESYLGGSERQNRTWKKQRPLERLKRLLEDPYLERAKLWACVQNPCDPAARDVSSLLNR